MRKLFHLTALGLLGTLAGCAGSAPNADPVDGAADSLSTTIASFVRLTLPNCAQTSCPAYVVQEVNKSTHGREIGNLDFSNAALTKEEISEISSVPAGGIVLKGTLGPVQAKTGLPSFVVLEAYRGLPTATYSSSAELYQGGDFDPPVCSPASCPRGSVDDLNKGRSASYDAIDLSGVTLAPDVNPDSIVAQAQSNRAIVAGAIVPSSVGGRSANVLQGTQVLVKYGLAPRLSVDQASIRDLHGNAIELRGWNWGEWGYEQRGDAARNVGEGASVVRIPLRWWGAYDDPNRTMRPEDRVDSRDDGAPATGYIEAAHLAELDRMVYEAASQKLWIDLFVDSDCGQGSFKNGDASFCGSVSGATFARNFQNSPDQADRFAQVWEFLVRRYRNVPYIAMYEILPEPQFGCSQPKTCEHPEAAPQFYAPILQRIRAIDPATPLLVGPTGAYEITLIDTAYMTGFGALVYTGDLLDKKAQDPANVQPAIDFITNRKAPVFVQQVGVRRDKKTDTDPNDDARVSATNILTALHRAHIGWTWWTYREKTMQTDGYAPLGIDKTTGQWAQDDIWLQTISAAFAR